MVFVQVGLLSRFRPDNPRAPSSYDRVVAAWQLTMELASALQQLSNYSTKNTRASRQIFESGVVIFRNNALHKLGDNSAGCNHSLCTHPPDHSTQAGNSWNPWR
jgi:hypothetical protein